MNIEQALLHNASLFYADPSGGNAIEATPKTFTPSTTPTAVFEFTPRILGQFKMNFSLILTNGTEDSIRFDGIVFSVGVYSKDFGTEIASHSGTYSGYMEAGGSLTYNLPLTNVAGRWCFPFNEYIVKFSVSNANALNDLTATGSFSAVFGIKYKTDIFGSIRGAE